MGIRLLASTSVQNEDPNSKEAVSSTTDPEPAGWSTSGDESSSNGDSSESGDSTSSGESSSTTSDSIESPGCIQEAQLSPDGAYVFTTDRQRAFTVYRLPSDLAFASAPQPLKSHAQTTFSEPIWAFTSLATESSTHVLMSKRDSYISLHNVSLPTTPGEPTPIPLNIAAPTTSYKFINHQTEAVIAPHSLTFTQSGEHFFAGAKNSIAVFDVEYGYAPINVLHTIPSSRNNLKGGGVGFKGVVSALCTPSQGGWYSSNLLAAGTWTRNIGLYDATSGQVETHFSLQDVAPTQNALGGDRTVNISGDGVSQMKWSTCGRYLYIAERASDVLTIYDARNFAFALRYCVGRNAGTKQKLGFDLRIAGPSVDGGSTTEVTNEIWAGGVDGYVRVWKDVGMKEGPVEPDETISSAQFDDADEQQMPVVSTVISPLANLAIVARGQLLEDERGGRMKQRGSLNVLGLS